MKGILCICGVALAAGLAACNVDTVNPGPAPAAATMSFKQGARYEFQSYHTDPSSAQKQDSSARVRRWTMVNKNATAYGKSGVAVYVDSVFGIGGVLSLQDSVYLKQETDNYVYRYASLAPEFDVSGVALFDLGKQWMQEARLNATSASWIVGTISDTLPLSLINVSIPGLQSALIKLTDKADSSSTETLTIGGTNYVTTRTVHKLELALTLNVSLLGAVVPIDVPLDAIYRRTWVSADLGAIVKEERDAKVLNASYSSFSFPIPVPGYHAQLTQVIATGN